MGKWGSLLSVNVTILTSYFYRDWANHIVLSFPTLYLICVIKNERFLIKSGLTLIIIYKVISLSKLIKIYKVLMNVIYRYEYQELKHEMNML